MVALHQMLGPGADREPVFPSYRGATTSLKASAYWSGSHRDYPMFNNRRLLEPIGNIPPAEAEAQYYAMLDDVSMAA
jgi:putative transposase